MTGDSFWASARRHPAAARYANDRVNDLYNRRPPAPEPEAEPQQPEAVARHAGEFVGLDSPNPRLLSAEEMVSLRLGYGAIAHPSLPSSRELDPAYQSSQYLAASQTSLGAAPTTTKTITTTEETS